MIPSEIKKYQDKIEVMLDATVLGLYEDWVLTVEQNLSLIHI